MDRQRLGLNFGPDLVLGGSVARLAKPDEVPHILKLRAAAFRGQGARDDSDPFDTDFHHLWVGRLGQDPSATVRVRLCRDAADVLNGYAAQVYDLTALAQAGGPVLELGRLCHAPSQAAVAADHLRLLWAGVARIALKTGAKCLVGCTSFPAADPSTVAPGLAYLAQTHIGPKHRLPQVKATKTVPLSAFRLETPNLQSVPALLRSYLMLGGWVSDHLVVDEDLGTCHVFTCVDIDTMPAARKRVLTRLAGL